MHVKWTSFSFPTTTKNEEKITATQIRNQVCCLRIKSAWIRKGINRFSLSNIRFCYWFSNKIWIRNWESGIKFTLLKSEDRNMRTETHSFRDVQKCRECIISMKQREWTARVYTSSENSHGGKPHTYKWRIRIRVDKWIDEFCCYCKCWCLRRGLLPFFSMQTLFQFSNDGIFGMIFFCVENIYAKVFQEILCPVRWANRRFITYTRSIEWTEKKNSRLSRHSTHKKIRHLQLH